MCMPSCHYVNISLYIWVRLTTVFPCFSFSGRRRDAEPRALLRVAGGAGGDGGGGSREPCPPLVPVEVRRCECLRLAGNCNVLIVSILPSSVAPFSCWRRPSRRVSLEGGLVFGCDSPLVPVEVRRGVCLGLAGDCNVLIVSIVIFCGAFLIFRGALLNVFRRSEGSISGCGSPLVPVEVRRRECPGLLGGRNVLIVSMFPYSATPFSCLAAPVSTCFLGGWFPFWPKGPLISRSKSAIADGLGRQEPAMFHSAHFSNGRSARLDAFITVRFSLRRWRPWLCSGQC